MQKREAEKFERLKKFQMKHGITEFDNTRVQYHHAIEFTKIDTKYHFSLSAIYHQVMTDLNPKSLHIFQDLFSKLPLHPKQVPSQIITIKDLLDFMSEAIVQDVSEDKKRFTCHIKKGFKIYRFAVNNDILPKIDCDSVKILNQNVKEHDLFIPIGISNI